MLRFNERKQALDPVTVSMLAAWADFWQTRAVQVTCENQSGTGPRYAQRLGLFHYLPNDGAKPLLAHEPAGRFVELRRVATQDELSALCADVASILRVPHLINLAQYFLAEMARNAIEHAGAPAFACAQYYEKDKRVTIGIADCGRGIQESLRENYGFANDRDAVLAALKPGVSGAARRPYSAPDNAGLGLYYARGISMVSSRPFVVVSGSCAFKQFSSQERKIPAHDPTKDHHAVVDIKGWQGTVVGLNIRGDQGDKDAFLVRMASALNIGSTISRKPKLRFSS
ncbi:MAG: hypothetical protein IPM35_01685 [Myxococcales bacterium]|nr:hypothetical protein [Myxococcales bacterium]